MGLFGLIKTAGEEVRADVKEWMGSKYFEAAVISGAGLFAEELTNAFALSSLNLTDWRALAYKTAHRLVFSALYYFAGKSFNRPLEAITASMMPIALVIIDGISYLMKATPEEAGAKLSQELVGWRTKAQTSAARPPIAKATYTPIVSRPAPVPSGLNIA